MQQLGFALAFGVLLDTFVIRPVIVPAFLAVMHDERYGNLSRYLK
jgi:RND superfamily putative drug exporter